MTSEIKQGLAQDIKLHIDGALESKGEVALDHLVRAKRLLQELDYVIWHEYHVAETGKVVE